VVRAWLWAGDRKRRSAGCFFFPRNVGCRKTIDQRSDLRVGRSSVRFHLWASAHRRPPVSGGRCGGGGWASFPRAFISPKYPEKGAGRTDFDVSTHAYDRESSWRLSQTLGRSYLDISREDRRPLALMLGVGDFDSGRPELVGVFFLPESPRWLFLKASKIRGAPCRTNGIGRADQH